MVYWNENIIIVDFLLYEILHFGLLCFSIFLHIVRFFAIIYFHIYIYIYIYIGGITDMTLGYQLETWGVKKNNE